MSHVTYQWVMSHINESCHISMRHTSSKMWHMWTMHVTWISESCVTRQRCMSHVYVSRVTCMNMETISGVVVVVSKGFVTTSPSYLTWDLSHDAWLLSRESCHERLISWLMSRTTNITWRMPFVTWIMSRTTHVSRSWQIRHLTHDICHVSRLLKIIGLFHRISSLLQGSFAKETCNFKEPTFENHDGRADLGECAGECANFRFL